VKRTALNLLIDFLAAFCFLGMIATGYILHFPLPPGTNKSLMLWGLSRHQWGEVHFWISIALLAVLLIHLVLHWQWVVSMVTRQFGGRDGCHDGTFRSGAVAFLTVSALFGTFAWLAETSVRQRDEVCCPPSKTAASTPQDEAAEAATSRPDFRKEVYPILESSCLPCHGPGRAQAGFRVDRKEDLFGGKGKKVWVIPGDSRNSPLLGLVSGIETGRAAPEIHRLSGPEIDVLRAWIQAGAEWPPAAGN
jgi:mono/diheme cytochrome c family protein